MRMATGKSDGGRRQQRDNGGTAAAGSGADDSLLAEPRRGEDWRQARHARDDQAPGGTHDPGQARRVAAGHDDHKQREEDHP
jgi:hypothetical protein